MTRDSQFDILQQYCESMLVEPDPVLEELERETHLSTVTPQMLSGRYQGRLLELLTRLKQPSRALEIGTFTGFSAICIARGMGQEGTLHTIEVNHELKSMIERFLKLAQIEDKVQLHMGDARDIVPSLEGPFDMVFIDAGKRDYPFYYESILPKVSSGGLILIDNVLWGGKVVTDADDIDTVNIRKLNESIAHDNRVRHIMLPVRDGISIVVKN